MADQSVAERPSSGKAAPDGVILKLENLSKTFPGTKALVERRPRHPRRRGARPPRSQRLGEVDADQGAVGLPLPRRRRDRLAQRRTGALLDALPRRARAGGAGQLRPPEPRTGDGAERGRQPRAARRLHPHRVRAGALARAGADRPAGSWLRSPSTSTSHNRCRRRHRSSARSSRSRLPCRAGTPAAAVCSCSTSPRRSCRPARCSGCSRSCATSGREVRASSTSRTVSTRSSSWPIV